VTDLDLGKGDPIAAAASESRGDKARATRATGLRKPSTSSGRKTNAQKAEEEIVARINAAFERLAEAFDARGDTEMAAIFREEQIPMSNGLVNLTRNIKPLRHPLVVILNLVEPLLAFGRLGRVLIRRIVERRDRKIAEYEAMQAEQPVQENTYQPAFP
jgi:hypothetical protein